jgi:hypothetical protein
VALRVAAWRRHGRGSFPGLPFLLRIGGATAVMAAVGMLWVAPWLDGDGAAASGWSRGLATLAAVAGLGAVYLVTASALGLTEGRQLGGLLRRRRAR